MSALTDAMDALEAACGALLGVDVNRYQGFVLSVVTPAIVVGWPTSVVYDAGPAGRALYEVPLTFAVELGHDAALGDFLSSDGLPSKLAGAEADGGWWGGLAVLTGELRGDVPNGSGFALVADLTVRFYA